MVEEKDLEDSIQCSFVISSGEEMSKIIVPLGASFLELLNFSCFSDLFSFREWVLE